MKKENIARIATIIIIMITLAVIVYFNINPNLKKSPDSNCITIQENPKSLNIVFLSYQYKSQDEFLASAKEYINGKAGFANIEPFKSNMDQLSFYAVYTTSMACSTTQGTLICDDYISKRSASKCPNDYIFVLGDINSFVDALVPIRSSAYLNLGSINTADNQFVVLHEFAHLFGHLVDEYVDEVSYKSLNINNAPNCDDSKCTKWSDFNNTQCLKGCSLSTFYRSQDYTIMRNYFKSNSFGVYNEWLLNQSLHR